MWEYGCSLRGSTRLLILSLISVIFWIRWNERNQMIFSQLEMMFFNSFILKVSHLFSMWTGIQFSLTYLCRDTKEVMVAAPGEVQDL
jgi:hypothetical protein